MFPPPTKMTSCDEHEVAQVPTVAHEQVEVRRLEPVGGERLEEPRSRTTGTALAAVGRKHTFGRAAIHQTEHVRDPGPDRP